MCVSGGKKTDAVNAAEEVWAAEAACVSAAQGDSVGEW